MEKPSKQDDTVRDSDGAKPSIDDADAAETLEMGDLDEGVSRFADETAATEAYLPNEGGMQETLAQESTVSPPKRSARDLFNDPKGLGEFALVEKLGSGGFGEVYRATDVRLNRDVAIKVVKRERAGDRDQREDFMDEARNVAQMRHPNIVPVHQVGEIRSGSPFIVYEFIDGPTLRQRKKLQKRFLPYEAVELLTKIADGLGYAHELGIVHRDVKPANILIEEKTGEPHIADFGCASRKEIAETADGEMPSAGVSGSSHTDDSRSYVGTLSYFSPEQAAGQSYLADARTDVWALGIVMDEMLSGKRPFRELEKQYGGKFENLSVYLLKIQTFRPTALRERVPAVDKDLNAIWRKCLELNPDDRYQNATELAGDFRRWQRNEPVKARPISLGGRLVRWAQRNQQVAALLFTVFGTILVAAIAMFFLWQRTRQYNREMAVAAVNALVKEDPENLAEELATLRGEGFRAVAADAMKEQWRTLTPRDGASIDSDSAYQTWRLSLGLTALGAHEADAGAAETQSPGSYFADQLCSDAIGPAELAAACDSIKEANIELDWLYAELNDCLSESSSEGQSLANRQLPALCALSMLGEVDDDASQKASRWLFELEARKKGVAWIPLARARFPDLVERLGELRDSFRGAGKGPDVEVIDDLEVAATDTADDLIRQIGAADRPLAALLPTLKLRIDELPEMPTFADFERLSSEPNAVTNREEADDATRMAKLWLAYLYCADLERDFSELNQSLFRTNDGEADRSAETRFVFGAFDSGITWRKIVQLCDRWYDRNGPSDERLATALVALGDFPAPANIPKQSRDLLHHIWTNDPHPHTHSACDWLVRQWNLSRDTTQLPSNYDEHRGWRFHNGHLFVRIAKPSESFQMGTDARVLAEIGEEQDATQSSYEVAHLHQIVGDFEISANEITEAQFREFLDQQPENPRWETLRNTNGRKSAGDDDPAASLSWFDAVEYSAWLSRNEKLPSCYGDKKTIDDAFFDVQALSCDRTLPGYRIPTSAEWEYACRAGTTTLWPFGDDGEYLEYFANVLTSKRSGRLQNVGMLCPNAFGMFDMLGNVAEWTDSPSRSAPSGATVHDREIRPAENEVIDFDCRGGGCRSDPNDARSGKRMMHTVDTGLATLGFRIVRTLPQSN